MVNPEHLTKLKEGVKVWNEWRDDNLGILPSLWRADLEEADRRGAIFLWAEQLCEAKTLHKAEIDPELELKVRFERPHLFQKPK